MSAVCVHWGPSGFFLAAGVHIFAVSSKARSRLYARHSPQVIGVTSKRKKEKKTRRDLAVGIFLHSFSAVPLGVAVICVSSPFLIIVTLASFSAATRASAKKRSRVGPSPMIG